LLDICIFFINKNKMTVVLVLLIVLYMKKRNV
jgi:hypothetical protein